MNYLLIFLLVFGGCTTTDQSSGDVLHHLMVTLEADINERYLQKKYEVDGIESVRPNNKTKNIYTCQFIKNQKSLDELIVRMKNDTKITAVEVAKVGSDIPINSTSSKSSKTKLGKN